MYHLGEFEGSKLGNCKENCRENESAKGGHQVNLKSQCLQTCVKHIFVVTRIEVQVKRKFRDESLLYLRKTRKDNSKVEFHQKHSDKFRLSSLLAEKSMKNVSTFRMFLVWRLKCTLQHQHTVHECFQVDAGDKEAISKLFLENKLHKVLAQAVITDPPGVL